MRFLFFQAIFYFFRLVSTFSDSKLPLQSLVFALISGSSGRLWFLAVLQRGQLHFLRLLLIPSLAVPRLADIFSVSIFQQAVGSAQ